MADFLMPETQQTVIIIEYPPFLLFKNSGRTLGIYFG